MGGMKRSILRIALAAMIVAVTFVASMMWTARYDRHPDPGARYRIEASRLERDRTYCWLEIHLRKNGDKGHDMLKPVFLVTADGARHELADSVFAGDAKEGFTEIWFKFWLDTRDLDGKIDLRMNDGTLKVKTNGGAPATDAEGKAVLKSADWGKSWLGF